jgi:S1 domain
LFLVNGRFGLEGLVNVSEMGIKQVEFYEEEYALEIGEKKVRLAAFDTVQVSIEAIREESTGKQKVKMLLIEPQVK